MNYNSNKILFILLHGYGSNGNDLEDVAKAIKNNFDNLEVVCPNAPFNSLNREGGYEWFPITEIREDYFLEGLRNIFPYIENYIDNQVNENGFKYENIILGGFSQGGCVSVHGALRFKNKIKGVVSFSGGIVDWKDALKKEINHRVPVCLIHGTQDRIIPHPFSKRTEKILKANEVEVELNLIEDCDHRIDKTAINHCINFIKKLS